MSAQGSTTPPSGFGRRPFFPFYLANRNLGLIQMVTAPGLGGVGPARVQKQAVFSGFVVSNYLLRRTAWTRGKDEYPPPGCD
jgi:hypothetical protein